MLFTIIIFILSLSEILKIPFINFINRFIDENVLFIKRIFKPDTVILLQGMWGNCYYFELSLLH